MPEEDHNLKYLSDKKMKFDDELKTIRDLYANDLPIPKTSINCLGSYCDAIIRKVKEMSKSHS